MIENCLNTILTGAKTLLSKKSTRDILKYLSTITLAHLGNKYRINQQKYDPMDMKNMIYHYNMNNDKTIEKYTVEPMMNLMKIQRFANDVQDMANEQDCQMVNRLIRTLNDNKLAQIYDEMMENNILYQFDIDTLETSSIADNYEISSGGVYLPDTNVYTSTIEGCNLANAKNDYLIKRIEIGDDEKQVRTLLNEYYNSIDFEKVLQYFNN